MTDEEKAMKEIEKQFKKDKAAGNAFNFIKDNLAKFSVLLIAFVYVLYGAFQLTTTDKSIQEIIGNIAVALIVGTSISLCMSNAGLSDAERSLYYRNITDDYYNTKNDISDKIDILPNYCNMKNSIALEDYKKSLIESVGLVYKAWKLGFYDIEENKSKCTVKQKVLLKEIDKRTIKPISPMTLLNEATPASNREVERYGIFGKSKKQYSANKTMSKFFGTILFSIVFGYYTIVPMFEEDTLSTIVWNLFQVIIWIGAGGIQYYDSKSFVLYDYCEKNIRTKTNMLKEFKAILNNNPNVLKKYADNIDTEIDKFIKEKGENSNGSEIKI